MSVSAFTPPVSGRRLALAVLAYVGVVAGLVAASLWLDSDLIERSDAVAGLGARLAELDAHAKPGGASPGDPRASGSPFLEGETITIAGAALQQRVDAAVAKAGGSVLSSQVELDGAQAKDGSILLTENIEIAQPALQTLLYDLEAGMPYLFVETLGVQTPQGEAGETPRLVVVIGVSGQWEPAR